MVANNPLFRGRWTWKKFGATVVDDIWPEVIFFTLIATVVTCVTQLTVHDLGVSNQLLTVLGLVLGLVISFRTSSAYERYQDGRKMWTTITVCCRNLGQMFWIHIPIQRTSPADSKEVPLTELQAVIEKKTMVNLVQAYAVAVKHLLRGEQGPYYEDLYPLISFLPRFANLPADELLGPDNERLPLWHFRDRHNHLKIALGERPEVGPRTETSTPNHAREKTLVNESSNSSSTSSIHERKLYPPPPRRTASFDPEAALPQLQSEVPLRPARSPPQTSFYDYFPVLRLFRWVGRTIFRIKHHEHDTPRKSQPNMVESHIPLEISLALNNYLAFLLKKGLLQPAIASAITNNLVLLQDTVSNLERICNTPLPFAYQAHLRFSLWLYLALLPFQLVSLMHWITIPATAFASFLLLGFLEIGQEIENPFNYDLNDLDLDYFCLAIERDLHAITAHVNPEPTDYLFTKWNQPLAPVDRRHAAELASNDVPYCCVDGGAEPGISSIRRTLVGNWKMVDQLTRKH